MYLFIDETPVEIVSGDFCLQELDEVLSDLFFAAASYNMYEKHFIRLGVITYEQGYTLWDLWYAYYGLSAPAMLDTYSNFINILSKWLKETQN